MAFLTTRVKTLENDDNKKLVRVTNYLRENPNLDLTLKIEYSNVAIWWVDSSFSVHPDMKSPTGAIIPLGKGPIYYKPI